MTLTTFGAIMGFAIEMLQRTGDFYRGAAHKAQSPTLREALQSLVMEEEKNRSLMERTRRENVTEMILEPIFGLEQEDYEIDTGSTEQAADADLLRLAVNLEERERKFFADASGKLPLPEAARVFRKIAEKKGSNLTKLMDLESSKS